MKKALLVVLTLTALMLALGTTALAAEPFAAAAEEVSAPAAPVAEEAPTPEETPAPVETAPPVETEAPEETPAPDVTVPPEETETPEETPPVETAPPEETESPAPTEPPEDRADGWYGKDGVWYYYKGGYKVKSDWVTDGGERYFFDWEGHMATGIYEIDGQTFRFNTSHDGAYGAMRTGWYGMDGDWYWFSKEGPMVIADWATDGRDEYYFDGEGKMVTGLQEIDGQTYWFNTKHDGAYGAMRTGWQGIGGYWYWFDSPSGEMVRSDWRYDGGNKFFLDWEGHMATGLYEVEDGQYYYFNTNHDGTYGAMLTGWVSVGGYYHWFDTTDGTMAVSQWVTDGGKRYYVDEDGQMVTGYQEIGGVTYYFNEKHDGTYGAMADHQTYINGEMYMFAPDGTLMRDVQVTLLDKTWYVDSNGVIMGYVTPAGRQAAAVLDQVGWNLRSAFNWVVHLRYANRWLRAPAGAVHTEWYANYGFTNHYGNCFVMNSTLYQMIKMMGYEVYFVEGGVLNSNGYLAPHGWTEVYHDGVQYVYDANFTNETGMNGFRIRYGQSGTWRYAQYKRVD